jgi:hypothetical protein
LKIEEKIFESYKPEEFDSKVEYVDFKEVILFDIKKSIGKENFKNLVRKIFKETSVNIRYRVDLVEDAWIDKSYVCGSVLVVIRTQYKADNIGNEVIESIKNLNLLNLLEYKGKDTFTTNDLRDVSKKFDRVVYEVKVDLKKETLYTSSQSNGGWKQRVLMWDGSIEDKRVDGTVKMSLKTLDSKSNVHTLTIDAPHGLDIYKIVEQELELPKNWLKDYPLLSLYVYESVDPKKNYLNRKKCSVTGKPIEMTVGGPVGDTTISELVKI